MRNRGSAILIDHNCIALIKRKRAGKIYYVFPGGGIETGETPEAATKREIYEELGLTINIIDLWKTLQYNGIQYFYLAEIVAGKFGTGLGEEYTDPYRDRGTYEPIWVPIGETVNLDIRPQEILELIQARMVRKN